MRSRRNKLKRSRSRRNKILSRVNIFKKAADAYGSYKQNKEKQKAYELSVQNIRLKYKDNINKIQDKIKQLNYNIKNKEDEKNYYKKQYIKKEEERKKLESMKGKVSYGIDSIRQRIRVLENTQNTLRNNYSKAQDYLKKLQEEKKNKIDHLKT
jgi:chromosome segregation ATPase